MKHLSILAVVLSLLFPTLTNAGKLSQKEFDELLSVYNVLLENRQASVDSAMAANRNPDDVINKMCLYVGTFETIQSLGLQNQNLDGASEAVEFGYNMKTDYEEFFTALGTTYADRCS